MSEAECVQLEAEIMLVVAMAMRGVMRSGCLRCGQVDWLSVIKSGDFGGIPIST